jgi:hypothetical protein
MNCSCLSDTCCNQAFTRFDRWAMSAIEMLRQLKHFVEVVFCESAIESPEDHAGQILAAQKNDDRNDARVPAYRLRPVRVANFQ